ncbi:hypothetical protein [Nostoc sp.]
MNKNNNVMKKKIQTLLRKALLQDAKMEYELFEYELKEHINYWYKGLKADQEELVFAVTENSGYVAMVLITKDKIIYINEDAREKLAQLWQDSYKKNIERLLPMMADNLVNNIISVNGVKISSGTQKPFFLEQKLLP